MAHSTTRLADELADAYLALADDLDDLAHDARSRGMREGVRPLPPGPRELERLARDSRSMARYRLPDLPDRRPRGEMLTPGDDARMRSAHPYSEDAIMELWPGMPTSRQQGLTPDEWTELRAALWGLSPAERRAMWLVRGRGMTHREAAQEMGTTAGSVYNLLERAERRIRAWRNGTPAQACWEF